MTLAFRTYIKDGRTYGGIVDNFRDPATGKSRTTSVRRYGNIDKLKETNPDFMQEVEAELARLNQDPRFQHQVDRNRTLSLGRDFSADYSKCDTNYSLLVKFGEVILRRRWEELGLHKLFRRIRTEQKIGYDIDAAAYCLVAARLASPGSKKKCYKASRLSLFNYADLKLEHMYSVLDVLSKKKRRIIDFINSNLDKLYTRDITVALYDVTTFYFESFDDDEVRAHGMSKEHRTAETQVVLGLLIDTEGVPVDYELFKGNTHEMGTMLKVVSGYLKRKGLKDITIVADAGLNCKENLLLLQEQGMKFIVAQSMRKLSTEYLDKALLRSMDGWDYEPNNFDHWRTHEIEYPIDCVKVDADGHKTKVTLNTRLIVNYSDKRYRKDIADIQKQRDKAQKMLDRGDSAIESGKARRYAMIAKFGVDEKGHSTGQPVKTGATNYTYALNNKLIDARMRVAGYYAFITNDPSFSKMDQYHRLRSLWRIEQCFRVMKTFLEARPVFVRTASHIRGHFVMCYLALVIERLCLRTLKEHYDPEFSTDRLVDFLNGPMLTKLARVDCSTQTLTKCVGSPYSVKDPEDLANLSVKLDQIFACFGVAQLLNAERAQSVAEKFGVNLKLNEVLTSSEV